jgi:hypothetical protein
MEGTPHLFWALTSLGGGVGFLGVGIAVRSLMVNGFFLSRPASTKPVPKDASPLQQAPSPEQSRLEGRNQILESSHWVLQQELLDVRGKMAEQGAQVARETALRMHLEVALGKAHEECDQLRMQLEASKQTHAEQNLQKSLLEAENSDLRGRLDKATQAPPAPPIPAAPAMQPAAVQPEVPTPAASIQTPRTSTLLITGSAGVLSATEGFPSAEPTVVPIRSKNWSIELQNFRRRTTEKPIKRGKPSPRSKSRSKS